MIPSVPQYDLFKQPLDNAGQFILEQAVGVLHLWRFEDAGGNLLVDGEVSVSFGGQLNDTIPFVYNSKIVFDQPTPRTTISWAAQPGKVAVFLTSRDPRAMQGDNQPVKQLVSSATGTQIAAGLVAIGTAPTLIRAANLTRAGLQILNDGASDVFVGPSTVALTTGFRLPAGASIDIDRTTAAIYGIVASGSVNVRYLEQS